MKLTVVDQRTFQLDRFGHLDFGLVILAGVPDGIRTRVTAVKGRCPRPLDDGDAGRVYKGCQEATLDPLEVDSEATKGSGCCQKASPFANGSTLVPVIVPSVISNSSWRGMRTMDAITQ